MMLRAIIALVIVALLHGLGAAWIDNRDLSDQLRILEHENLVRKQMIQDMRHVIPHLERKVAHVNYDYSPQEFLWLMADVLKDQGCAVQIH